MLSQAAAARNAAGGDTAAALKAALAWARDLRSMLRYVAEYTLSIRVATNPATGATWTDAERGAEFLRVFRLGCVALILGRRDDPLLKLLKHPVTEIPGWEGVMRTSLWTPKGDGFVKSNTWACVKPPEAIAKSPISSRQQSKVRRPRAGRPLLPSACGALVGARGTLLTLPRAAAGSLSCRRPSSRRFREHVLAAAVTHRVERSAVEGVCRALLGHVRPRDDRAASVPHSLAPHSLRACVARRPAEGQ